MALTYYVAGHGAWFPEDGHFNIPKGCSIDFLVNFAKLMPSGTARNILAGAYKAEVHTVVGEFKSCPNMTWLILGSVGVLGDQMAFLKNPEPNKRLIHADNFMEQLKGGKYGPHITLKDWFAKNKSMIESAVKMEGPLKFKWACCMQLMLKATDKGADIGVNAGQHENCYSFLNLTKGINPTGKVAPL